MNVLQNGNERAGTTKRAMYLSQLGVVIQSFRFGNV